MSLNKEQYTCQYNLSEAIKNKKKHAKRRAKALQEN